ncbi:MAG TPA: Gfo/Idh/MocA family oxidoreductase [Polyangiaceae bacterium]|nr:Gfo/Idh/MocA family oxidoreductase [Polyangiaceae bacterium]
MTLKVVIVGCGKIADGHVEEIQKLGSLARVVGVCDLEPLMAEQLALRYGIRAHGGALDALLERERPDVVHITTPPGAHLELARRAVAAGCHIFVEKPVAPTFAETAALVKLCEDAGKVLTVGYSYRFDPPALAMRQLLAEGVLGEIVHVESYYGYNLSGPFGSALLADGSHWVHRLPGKLLQNNLDHLLDKLVEFVPDEQPTIAAHGAVRRAKRFGDARDKLQDELRLMLHGTSVSAYGTFSAHARPAGHFCQLYGTKNTLHVDYVSRTVTLGAAPKLPSAAGRLLPAFEQALAFARAGLRNLRAFGRAEFQYFAGLNELLTRFYRSIVELGEPPIPYRDILWIARVSERVFQELERQEQGPALERGVA